MGITVDCLLWVMQDLYHQPYSSVAQEQKGKRELLGDLAQEHTLTPSKQAKGNLNHEPKARRFKKKNNSGSPT